MFTDQSNTTPTGAVNNTANSGLEATNQLLTFMLAGEEYGVDILQVQEIRGWSPLTKLPNTPDYMIGVMNLRGTIVPVMDLRKRFGLEQKDYDTTTVVIVLKVMENNSEKTIGIIVDAVSDAQSITANAIQPPPEYSVDAGIDCVRALVAMQNKMLIILDTDKLFSGEE